MWQAKATAYKKARGLYLQGSSIQNLRTDNRLMVVRGDKGWGSKMGEGRQEVSDFKISKPWGW